jgi:hypothetical protein
MIDRLERRNAWGIAHRRLVWDWNHDAPEEEHWMRGLLAPDPSVLRLSAKFPADPGLRPSLSRRHAPGPFGIMITRRRPLPQPLPPARLRGHAMILRFQRVQTR